MISIEHMKAIEKWDRQYDLIRRFLKNSLMASPYDDFEWDGETLDVILAGATIETYSHAELVDILDGFA